jgi:hypothetical protein
MVKRVKIITAFIEYFRFLRVSQHCRKPKRMTIDRVIITLLVILLSGGLVICNPISMSNAQETQPNASEVTPDKWPRTAQIEGTTYTIYQPQLDTWDGFHFEAHAAASVLAQGAKDPAFGVIYATANTFVDRINRSVEFKSLRVVKATFPASPDKAEQYRKAFEEIVSQGPATTSLDRLQAALSIQKAEQQARAVPVKNDPPKFVFSQTAVVLILVDGDPVWRVVEGTSLTRLLNTRALILGDASGNMYLHLFDGFLQATSLSGPWQIAPNLPPEASTVADKLSKERVVDLMEGSPNDQNPSQKPSLSNGVPSIIVATTPTELIVTSGPPEWMSIQGTNLLYVNNTTGNVFKNMTDQNTYVLVTGRWFRSPDFSGPWQYVPGSQLPQDFTNIPDDSPKENVKASVPGTPQAAEAAIATQIPQTASVDRTKATFEPVINGEPILKPIQDVSLMYVYNSPNPIFMVSENEWYAVQNGVWFTASSVRGPWVVAGTIPAVIYSIPPSSPLHYVTYVKIYDVTPQYVVVGYTPGYMGTIVSTDGVVVYGTGYTYTPYIGTTV